MFLLGLVFAMSLCASVYMCFVVTCWERADLFALVCGVCCEFVTFPLALESPYHLAAVSGAHFTLWTILIVILVSSGSAKSGSHQFVVGGFLVTRRGWPGRLRACRIWTFINSV